MPRKPSNSALLAVALFATASAVSVASLAWTQSAPFETRVHGHAFSRVVLESRDCVLDVRLPFDAPEAAYKNDAAPTRNVYRFHARIKLDDQTFETPIFQNSAPGARSYTYAKDTSAEACWAKREHQLRAVDVEGCRGAGCRPEAFK